MSSTAVGVVVVSSRTDMFLVVPSRTVLDDDVVDVTSSSALDVVEIKDMFLVAVVVIGARRSGHEIKSLLSSSSSALDVVERSHGCN